MKPAEGTVVANRFQLLRELAHGSMGSVWLAKHLTLEVRCAVKFIAGELVNDPRYRAQFNVEARAIAQVQSPYVVRVLDHGIGHASGGDVPYIAFEYLDGEDLRTRLERTRRPAWRAVHGILSQVARGLSRAHAAGVVHRDLKPENIFLAREGEDEVVKLVDFGAAKWARWALPASAGVATGLIGTPVYMSPEQMCGGPVDHRSDIWSLAVIAYECLTGRLPFEGATMAELRSARSREAGTPVEGAAHGDEARRQAIQSSDPRGILRGRARTFPRSVAGPSRDRGSGGGSVGSVGVRREFRRGVHGPPPSAARVQAAHARHACVGSPPGARPGAAACPATRSVRGRGGRD